MKHALKKESAQDRKGSRHWKKEKVAKLLEGNLFIPIFFCSKHVGYFQKYTAYYYNKKAQKVVDVITSKR